MRASFEVCFAYIMESEGGYSNDPKDPGGPTKYGVTLGRLRDYRGDQSLTAAAVQKLTKVEAREIFRACYWDLVMADELPAGLDYAVVDFGYHSGPARAIKLLQELIGVKVDGVAGPATRAAIQRIADPDAIALQFNKRRAKFLFKLKVARDFPAGMRKRMRDVEHNTAVLLKSDDDAATTVASMRPPEHVPKADAKPYRTPERTGMEVATFGGMGTAATEAANQLYPLADTLVILKYICAGLLVIGVVVGLYAAMRPKESEA